MNPSHEEIMAKSGESSRGGMPDYVTKDPASHKLSLRQSQSQQQGKRGKCFKLTDSTACPDFRDFSVRSIDAFRKVKEFDNFIYESHAASDDFKQKFSTSFGCNEGVAERQRYHKGFLCSYMITQGGCDENIKVKNSGRQVICREQCNQFIDSTRAIFQNQDDCTQNPAEDQAISRVQSVSAESEFSLFCGLIPENLDPGAKQCSRGLTKEFNQCGFLSRDMAGSFCDSSAGNGESCCKALRDDSGGLPRSKDTLFYIGRLQVTKKTLFITGAAVGGAVLLAALLATIIIYKKRRKQRKIDSSIDSLGINSDFRPDISMPRSDVDVAKDDAGTGLKQFPGGDGNLDGIAQSDIQQGLFYDQDQAPDSSTLGYGPGSLSKSGGKLNNEYTTGLTYLSTSQQNVAQKGANGVIAGVAAGSGNQKVVKVIRPYTAELSDELTLVAGDIITVDEVFDDDWAVGKNEATGEVGMFPMVCVEPSGDEAKPDSQDDINRKISNRGSSLVYSANAGL